MIDIVPAEISLGFVFIPPFAIVVIFGIVAALAVTAMFGPTRLSYYFWHPQLAFLALIVFLGAIFALFVLPP